MAYWISGTGASVVNYLMADAATCEVSRAQLWVWLKYKVELDDGQIINEDLIDKLIFEELNKTKKRVGDEIFKKIPFENNQPNLIIANTIKGKGISFIENQVVWHHKLPSEEEYNNAIQELNIQLENFK